MSQKVSKEGLKQGQLKQKDPKRSPIGANRDKRNQEDLRAILKLNRVQMGTKRRPNGAKWGYTIAIH